MQTFARPSSNFLQRWKVQNLALILTPLTFKSPHFEMERHIWNLQQQRWLARVSATLLQFVPCNSEISAAHWAIVLNLQHWCIVPGGHRFVKIYEADGTQISVSRWNDWVIEMNLRSGSRGVSFIVGFGRTPPPETKTFFEAILVGKGLNLVRWTV